MTFTSERSLLQMTSVHLEFAHDTSCVRRHVVKSATIPRNWQSFLRIDSNKVGLFHFLSEAVINSFDDGSGKMLVVTDGQQVLSAPAQESTGSLAPCTHEETDTHLMLDACHTAQHGHHQILV